MEDQPFSVPDYKTIIGRQDATRSLLNVTTGRFLDYDWQSLAAINEQTHPAYRWYARQRIHSKFSFTAISCAIGVLDIAAMILQLPVKSAFVTVELPVNLPGIANDCVMGWPIYAGSRKPVPLTFNRPDRDKLKDVAARYGIVAGDREISEDRFVMATPFGGGIEVQWRAEEAYDFHSLFMSNLMSVTRIRDGARVRSRQDRHAGFAVLLR